MGQASIAHPKHII